MENSVSVCPVPSEQQPINEYQELKESWFFHWVTLDWRGYARKLTCVWTWSLFIAAPLAAASFAPLRDPVQFILCATAGAGIGIVLVLSRLFLGWSYVRDRLLSPTVFYEESGWYDGQTWAKPEEVITRDRLIAIYQVQPILQKIKLTFGLVALFFSTDALIWCFL